MRWLAAATALYSCLFLLLTLGSMLEVTEVHQASGIQIDPIRPTTDAPFGYRVSGQVPPRSFIRIGVHERMLENTFTGPTGHFEARIRSPFVLSEVWVRVTSPDTQEELGTRPFTVTQPIEEIPLFVDVAYHVTDADLLWIAGRGAPFQSLRVLAQDGTEIGRASTNFLGIFDQLIPVAGPQERVSVAWGEWRTSFPEPVLSSLAESLPLARIAVLDQSGPRARVSLRIVLPRSHPYFVAASQGFLPTYELVDKAFGSTSLPEFETATVEVGEGKGILRLEQSFEVAEIPHFRLSGSQGIGSRPLLSTNDQVILVFGKHRPQWLGDVLPVELHERAATWRGPVQSETTAVVELGSARSAGDWRRASAAERAGPDESPEEANVESMLHFTRSFENRVRAQLPKQAWRTLILLIPFAGFLLFARRPPFGPSQVWRPLAAAALVLAVWRCWGFFYSLALAGPAVWLNRTIVHLLGLGVEVPRLAERVEQGLTRTGPNAFWLVFVSLVALAPLYFDDVVQAAPRWRPPVRKRKGNWRTAWTVAKGFLGATVLAALLLLLLSRDLQGPPPGFALLERWVVETKLLEQGFPWVLLGLTVFVLACLFLATFGVRGLLLGLALLATGLHWISQGSLFLQVVGEPYREGVEAFARVPAGWFLPACGLAAFPALSALLGRLVPFTPGQTRLRRALAASLVAVSLLLPQLPIRWLLPAGGALLVVGFGWVILHGLPWRRTPRRPDAWWNHPLSWRVTALALFGFAISWPFPQPNEELQLFSLERLMSALGQLFPWALALGVVLLLLDHAARTPSVIQEKAVLRLGAYLYAVFLINSSATWLLVVPVPLLVALALAAGWLFRPTAETSRLERLLPARRRGLRALLAHVLGSVDATGRFRAIRKTLTDKLEKAEIEPDEYERKLALYRNYLEDKAAQPAPVRGVDPRTLVFAVGGPRVRTNTRAALRTGALLALAPLSIALYQFLPNRQVVDPYPVADLLVFLVGGIASWLLYAFFFGYFFPHLRGNSGLTKGIHLFSVIVLPFAVYRLLYTPSLMELRPFLLWASQVFLFCSLLGLLAFDYGLLRRQGFSARDLRRVHELPALSAYASTVVAALIPAVLAILNNRVTELVSFFLNTILPRVPTP